MKKAYLQMHIAIFLWGFTGVFGKAINMSEGMIVWYRMLFSAAGLIPLLYTKKIKLPGIRETLRISIVGAMVALHWLLFYGAIKASNVSVALSCFSSISLFTAVLEPLSRRKAPKLAELILGIAVIAGLYILFSVQQVYASGIILATASALLGACFTIANKRLTENHEAEVITFFELTTGFVILTIALPFYFTLTDSGMQLPGKLDLFYLLLLSIVCTSYAFIISLRALKALDPFTLNLSVNLEPIYSIVLAVILFRERDIFNSGFALGACIILGSVALHSWYKWRSHLLESK